MTMPDQKPTVGRIVHFINEDGQRRAAMIVWVWNDQCVNLQVFPTGLNGDVLAEVRMSVCITGSGEVPSWEWPPRE